jgi:hypothetical protein
VRLADRGSTAVERLLPEILQCERLVIRATRDVTRNPGVDDLPDEDGVIPLLDGIQQRAIEEGRRVGEDG